jgi:type IV pilus assembly protein PilQ
MKTLLSKLFLPIILMAFTFGCATAPAVKEASTADNPAVLTKIAVQGDTLSIVCSRNFIYTIYSSNDPYKMTIEIPDMRLGNFTQKMEFDNARVTEIIPQQTESPHPSVKLDLTLQAPSSSVAEYKNNTLTVLMKNEQPAASGGTHAESAVEEPAAHTVAKSPDAAVEKTDVSPNAISDEKHTAKNLPDPEAAEMAPKTETPPPLEKASEITGVELKKAQGAVKVVITGNGSITPNIFPLDERIVIDIPSVSLRAAVPESVIRPLKGIRTGKHKDGVRIVLDLRKKTHYDVSTEGKSVVIAFESAGVQQLHPAAAAVVAPKAASVEAAAEETSPKEANEPISGEQVAKVVPSVPEGDKIAGKYTGKKISLDFQDAEIGPIFRLLADVNGYNLVLDPSVKGKITIKLMNVPWDQALDIILNTFNLSKSIEGNILWIAPTSVFAKILDDKAKEKEAAEKAEALTQEIIRINYASAADISSAITQGKLLSPRGSITIDSRMNTLIIKDTPQSIAKIKDLVGIMDVTKPQVMIEAKLVQVSTDYSQSLGINWGGTFSTQTWPNTLGGSFSVNTPTVPAGPAASNPGGALNLTVGHASAINVSLSLSALESIGKSKTLSNPRVLTMDNEAATIQQGRNFFIEIQTQNGPQTQQQTATLNLTVTPKITPDGYIQLKVAAADNSLEPGTQGNTAVVDTKSLTTQALVKNGETLVLGGIYTRDETETESSVPLLGKIPGLGWLFKTRTQTGPSVKELLIFITPTIISQPKTAANDKF